jgi:hypothetical protein
MLARFFGSFGVLARGLVTTFVLAPVVDIASNVVGQLFGQFAGTPLGDAEKNLASTIFGDQIPLWRIRVVTDSSFVNYVGSLLGFGGQTNGDVIFLPTPAQEPVAQNPDPSFAYVDGNSLHRIAQDISSSDVLSTDVIYIYLFTR